MGAKGDDMRTMCCEWLNDSRTVILDTETTGMGARDEILELSVLGLDGTLFDELIRPVGLTEWPEAERIHGISPEMVKGKPGLGAYSARLWQLLGDRRIVVYNAPYDKRMLSQSLEANGLLDWSKECVWQDVMVPYAKYWGDYSRYHGNYRWQSLTNACAQQGVTIENAHRALGDCRMTLALIQKLARS
jgi:DNA polymerase III subunit epsilon